MKTVIIHGQAHQGSTYHIAHELAEKIGGDVTEFFLPKDFSHFCTGCTNCFRNSEQNCPHYAALAPITQAMYQADVIVLASPVYVYHATGAMKAFLDHLGYRFMVHRPHPSMFKKQGVCVTTAAGAGMKSTIKDMADSLFFWGIAKQYRLGFAVMAINWDAVTSQKKALISRRIDAVAQAIAIRQRNGKVKPGLKTKAFFSLMRMIKKKGWIPGDEDYWNENGWTGKARPWK